jgi:CelD/BcsL family acetyltransferase involved in cellulose biosynthesis
MVTVTYVGDYGALCSLSAEWTALVERCPPATPFQRPEWLLPWWRQFGSGEMSVLAFHDEQRLVGLLPAFLHVWEGRRQVTLIGTGVTDYVDLVAEPARGHECAATTIEWLRHTRDRWDVCDWQDLSAASPLLKLEHQLRVEIESSLPGTVAALPPDPAQYEESLPHGLRRSIRVASRRLEREQSVTFETARQIQEASTLEALFRLHEERWAEKGGPQSMLDSKSTQQFLIDATKALGGRGMVRLYTMRYGGEIAAVIYSIFDRARMYGYITGMDPALRRFSPGSLLLNYAIAEAIREGARAWDFLRGDEAYKFQWGAQKVPKYRLRLHSQSESEDGSPQIQASPKPIFA